MPKKIAACAAAMALTLGLAISTVADADTPYDAFGQKPGIDKVIGDFLVNVLADPRIKTYFTNANIPVLHAELNQQVCMELGGPCKFTENMKTVHQSLGVTNGAFNALVEDLQTSMNAHDIPLPAQNYLLFKLAPMQKDIVTK